MPWTNTPIAQKALDATLAAVGLLQLELKKNGAVPVQVGAGRRSAHPGPSICLRDSCCFLCASGCVCVGLHCMQASENLKDPVVTQVEGYVGGIKIWNTGMIEDVVPGSKRGKGVQHMNSDYWIEDMGVFIHQSMAVLKAMLARIVDYDPEVQYTYLLNQANVLLMRALRQGLQTASAEKQWLMASWLAMAAAEVDSREFTKHSKEQRAERKHRFFSSYLLDAMPVLNTDLYDAELQAPQTRIDLLPAVALERLSLHNELCQVKYGDEAGAWMREGFKLSRRVDSLKRHMDEAYHREPQEDAVAHLIWNFMAIHHVRKVFPCMNDLTNFEAFRTPPSPKPD